MGTNDDDDWEDTGPVDVPFAAPARRLQSVHDRAPPIRSTDDRNASARAALAKIGALGKQFDAHSASDEKSLGEIKDTLKDHTSILREQNSVLTTLRIESAETRANIVHLVRERTELQESSKAETQHKRSRLLTILGQIGPPLAALITGMIAMFAAGKC